MKIIAVKKEQADFDEALEKRRKKFEEFWQRLMKLKQKVADNPNYFKDSWNTYEKELFPILDQQKYYKNFHGLEFHFNVKTLTNLPESFGSDTIIPFAIRTESKNFYDLEISPDKITIEAREEEAGIDKQAALFSVAAAMEAGLDILDFSDCHEDDLPHFIAAAIELGVAYYDATLDEVVNIQNEVDKAEASSEITAEFSDNTGDTAEKIVGEDSQEISEDEDILPLPTKVQERESEETPPQTLEEILDDVLPQPTFVSAEEVPEEEDNTLDEDEETVQVVLNEDDKAGYLQAVNQLKNYIDQEISRKKDLGIESYINYHIPAFEEAKENLDIACERFGISSDKAEKGVDQDMINEFIQAVKGLNEQCEENIKNEHTVLVVYLHRLEEFAKYGGEKSSNEKITNALKNNQISSISWKHEDIKELLGKFNKRDRDEAHSFTKSDEQELMERNYTYLSLSVDMDRPLETLKSIETLAIIVREIFKALDVKFEENPDYILTDIDLLKMRETNFLMSMLKNNSSELKSEHTDNIYRSVFEKEQVSLEDDNAPVNIDTLREALFEPGNAAGLLLAKMDIDLGLDEELSKNEDYMLLKNNILALKNFSNPEDYQEIEKLMIDAYLSVSDYNDRISESTKFSDHYVNSINRDIHLIVQAKAMTGVTVYKNSAHYREEMANQNAAEVTVKKKPFGLFNKIFGKKKQHAPH